MVEITLALIAAVGSVLTAYVAVLGRRTLTAVNGNTSELVARVAQLEELLSFARAAPAEPSPAVDVPRPRGFPID